MQRDMINTVTYSTNSISKMNCDKTRIALWSCWFRPSQDGLHSWQHKTILSCTKLLIVNNDRVIPTKLRSHASECWGYLTSLTSFPLLLLLDRLAFSIFGKMCLSKYFLSFSIKNGLMLAWTLLCPIPLIKRGSARYGSMTVSRSRSEWLNGTMLSLVPWINSTGLRIEGAKSTLGNLSPGSVQPLSITIR